MSYNLTNLLSGNWSEVDWVWLIFAAVLLVIVLYFLIQWVRSSNRGYSDSADDHAKGCLETVGWGCMIPVTVVVLLVTTVAAA